MPRPYSSKDQENYAMGLGERLRIARAIEGKNPETGEAGHPRINYPTPI